MSTGKPTAIGYFDAGAADPGYVANAGTVTGTSTYVSGGKTHTVYTQPEAQYSFTTSEIMLFNRMERLKSAPPGNTDYNASYYIAGYTPRYYKLRDDAPIYQYKSALASSDLKEHAVNYGSPGVKTLNTTSTSPDYIGANAAVLSLAPKNGWISENVLRRVWFNDEAARRANPTVTGVDPKNGAAVRYAPFKFDGLLYTNNCIFGLTRGNTRHKSMTYGKLWIRGSIVCADLGLLSADTGHEAEYRSDGTTDPYYGGIEVYYDKRVDAFLNVEDPTQVTFARLAYQYAQS
jgi:hypothetical protein